MKCINCGKEYSDEFEYCPYCAEPKPRPQKTQETVEKEYVDRMSSNLMTWHYTTLLSSVIMCSIGIIFDSFNFLIIGAAGFVIDIIYVLVKSNKIEKIKNNSRQLKINAQFSADQTSICPKCGSHNIKIYRKGYDYGKGYWQRLIGVKGAGFAAGFDKNKACCRCLNCGNDWETDYDYRLIK